MSLCLIVDIKEIAVVLVLAVIFTVGSILYDMILDFSAWIEAEDEDIMDQVFYINKILSGRLDG